MTPTERTSSPFNLVTSSACFTSIMKTGGWANWLTGDRVIFHQIMLWNKVSCACVAATWPITENTSNARNQSKLTQKRKALWNAGKDVAFLFLEPVSWSETDDPLLSAWKYRSLPVESNQAIDVASCILRFISDVVFLSFAEDLESESDLKETTVPSTMDDTKREPKANTEVRKNHRQ